MAPVKKTVAQTAPVAISRQHKSDCSKTCHILPPPYSVIYGCNEPGSHNAGMWKTLNNLLVAQRKIRVALTKR